MQPKVQEIIERHLKDEVECNMSWIGEFRKHLDRGELIRYVRHLEGELYGNDIEGEQNVCTI